MRSIETIDALRHRSWSRVQVVLAVLAASFAALALGVHWNVGGLGIEAAETDGIVAATLMAAVAATAQLVAWPRAFKAHLSR